MDHDYIQEHQVVDRYVLGNLTEAEADLFEDHYLTCEECLRRLRIAEKFQRGFRQVAAEDAVKVTGLLAALLRSRRGLVLGSVLVLLLAVSGLSILRMGRDLEETRARLVQAEDLRAGEARRAEEARSAAETLRSRLAQELEREAEPPQRPAAMGAWLVTLIPVRSGPAAGEPAQRITLPPSPAWIVLSLDLDLAADTYRAVLERQGGGVVWKGEALRPGPDGLAIGLDSSLLGPGDYRLRVEQGAFPVARFTFRVVKPD